MRKKKRSFKEVFEELGDIGVKEIASEYANEDDSVTYNFLSDKYNITLPGLKKLIDYAITNCVISYKTAILIEDKARRNQLRHYKHRSDVTSSDTYYATLFEKRLKFVKSLNNSEVIEVVDYYLDNSHLPVATLADSLGFSVKEFNVILKKSIIFDIIDDKKCKCLIETALSKAEPSSYVFCNEIFTKYNSHRNYYKFLTCKISMLKFQLQNYDSFVSSDEADENSYSSLENDLKKNNLALEYFVENVL